MAGKKDEEQEEANVNEETNEQINALKSNLKNQTGFNEALINLLENYNGNTDEINDYYLKIGHAFKYQTVFN